MATINLEPSKNLKDLNTSIDESRKKAMEITGLPRNLIEEMSICQDSLDRISHRLYMTLLYNSKFIIQEQA